MNAAITLRMYKRSDAEEMVRAAQESLADLLPWMPWASSRYTLADAEEWVRVTREGHATRTMFDFAVADAQGRYCGAVGLNQINKENRIANLGYWIRTSASGRGIAPEAVKQLVTWGFANTTLNRLEIVIALGNVRSQRVAEKAGAVRDAVLKQRLIVDGRASDAVMYSFVRP